MSSQLRAQTLLAGPLAVIAVVLTVAFARDV